VGFVDGQGCDLARCLQKVVTALHLASSLGL
jgi:hypothetical protein